MSAKKRVPTPINEMPKFLTTAEAAEILRTTVPCLATQRCVGGATPPYIKRGRTVLYDRDALLSWMESQTRGY